jgi:hypothetical protein
MTVAQLTFDTLAYANKLKSGGLSSKLAEAHAEAQAELLSDLLDDKLATKQDIKELGTEMKMEMKLLENRLLLKLGAITAAGVGLLATLITIFHA